MNILEVVNAVTGTAPRLVTQVNGGEYSSPCPFCGGNKRFRTWPEKKDGQGRWWCRECGETGDTIDLLRRCKNMSFGEAKRMLGLPDNYGSLRKTEHRQPHHPAWSPRKFCYPSDIWREFARKLVLRAGGFITRPYPIQELWKRGITTQTADFFQLGYIPKTCKVPGRLLGYPEYSGCCRFVWNKIQAMNLFRLEHDLPIVRYQEAAWFLTIWKQSEEYSFLKDVPAQVLQQTLKNLDRAWMDGFDRRQPLKRLPRFKKKGQRESFRFPQGFKVDGKRIFLPKTGWLRFYKSREIEGTPKNVTVSQSCGHWYISIQTAMNVPEPVHPSHTVVGIDLGVARFATLSDGMFYRPLNSFRNLQEKLAREQRTLAGKQKFSNNWKKQKAKVSRVHAKIANARKDYLHKSSTSISKNHAVVVLEDLRVRNMSKSAKGSIEDPGRNVKAKSGLNKSILDQGWSEFRRQLEYKQAWRGGKVIAISPQYTSQTCPSCGHVSKENRKTQSVFKCQRCGHRDNADVVAAQNILTVGQTVTACGEMALADSTKQEPGRCREARSHRAAA